MSDLSSSRCSRRDRMGGHHPLAQRPSSVKMLCSVHPTLPRYDRFPFFWCRCRRCRNRRWRVCRVEVGVKSRACLFVTVPLQAYFIQVNCARACLLSKYYMLAHKYSSLLRCTSSSISLIGTLKLKKISNLKLTKHQKRYSTQIVSMHVFRIQLSCSASFSV